MNSKDEGHHPEIALSDEAINWIVRLHSGRATQDDQDAFAQWRQRSPQHVLAAQEAEAIWHGVAVAGSRVRKSERKTKLTRRAAMGGALLATTGLALHGFGIFGPGFADHATGVGEQANLTLSDGSTAFLNAGSALSVDFGSNQRLVSLLEGQAAFIVTPDKTRPFVVKAGAGRTLAVGTVFDVDIRSKQVVVTVLEGTVSVSTDVGTASPILAGADNRVAYSSDGHLSSAEAVDATAETAWRRGKLIFNRRPLGDVVAELQRYRHGRILILNHSLRTLEVTGVFNLAEPDSVLRAVEDTLPVTVSRLPLVTILR